MVEDCEHDLQRRIMLAKLGLGAAAIGLAAGGATVVEVGQDLQRLLENLVGLAAVEIGDEADAARVVLVGRVIHSCGGWEHGNLSTLGSRRVLPA